ncbi:PEP/pyruvate-binding domain-containing protein [Pseudoalteromonas rubra]|uniref:PEP/pyruvate-binding domain-containing protein n=1 Tax=Pseudoalteromonas rubra TaxID=43658 RepID=UPI000F79E636|nr:PEP/pyruvate-binding domain-containing protein [Pseudoalteromonas rubra]
MEHIGGKARSMVELAEAGIRVPPFKAISAEAQHEFITMNNLSDVLKKAIEQGENAYLAALRELRASCKMPKQVKQLWQEIRDEFPDHASAGIVRSSAACEDGAELSFAGMFDSVSFDLTSVDSFFKSLISVWLSPFKPPVLNYLKLCKQSQLIDTLDRSMGVLIQPMMHSSAAGVGFAVDPLSGENVLTVKAVRGNGEMLNTMGVCQSEYREHQGALTLKKLELQKVMLMRTDEAKLPAGSLVQHEGYDWVVAVCYQSHLHSVRVPKPLYQQPCLTVSQRADLLAQFNAMLAHYGERNFEFEWLVDEGTVYIVQARPITAVQGGELDKSALSGELVPIVHGDFSGEVIEWRAGLTKEQVQNKIVVTYQMNYDLIAVLDEVEGIITQVGDSHAHAAIICRELGVSVYKYAEAKKLKSGQRVSIIGGEWDVAA